MPRRLCQHFLEVQRGRALALMTKGLGPAHPDVMEVREPFARLLRELGREAEAAEVERPAAQKR